MSDHSRRKQPVRERSKKQTDSIIWKRVYLKMKPKIFLLTVFLISISLLPVAFAGVTGKIAGVVLDFETQTPLPGVNIVISGTEMGSASDADGRYFITNIPPGTYDVKARMMGYKEVHFSNVRVTTELTTTVNFSLQPTVIEGESVTIVAEQPMVQKDVTAKMAIIDGATIANQMPVTTINDVLKTQAGVVEDADGSIHIRGGRSGEVAYFIDGVLLKNVLSGGFGGALDVNSIQELSVLTGGFNAEYGDAMSGVVNVTTKEGSDKFRFRFQYESPMLNASPYHQQDWILGSEIVDGMSETQKQEFKDAVRDSSGQSAYTYESVLDSKYKDKIPVKILGRFSGSASGRVPFLPNLQFFLSGVYRNENSALPWGFNLEQQFFSKLTYKFSPEIKLALNYQHSWDYDQVYDHTYKFSDYYNSLGLGDQPTIRTFTDRLGLALTHAVNPATFYTLNLSYFYRNSRREIEDRTVIFDPETGAFIDSDYIKRAFIFGREGDFWYGDDRDWYRYHTATYNAKFDLTSQIHNNHQVKFGFDLKQNNIFRHRIQRAWNAAFYHRIEYYDRNPFEGAVFIQDKMEYDFMILNMGVRLDYVHNNDTYWEDPGNIQYIDQNNQFQFQPQVTAPKRLQISPRIGLAHPVTDKLVFHFAYGHFFQNPTYSVLFRNDTFLPNLEESDPILGNPGLKPQKTIAFEVGGKYQVADDIALDVTGYYRDMRNLVATQYYARAPYDYTIFINQDYGRVKGFDLTITKRYSHYISGTLNYTYMKAKGSGNDPLSGYYYREEDAHLRPKREIYLDFDRTHDLSLNLDLRFPENFSLRPLASTGLNLIFSMASGLPYTPVNRYEATFNIEPNSERIGSANSLDLRLDRRVKWAGLTHVFYIKAENIFDHINPRYVWSETGDPWDGGPTTRTTKDRQANPANVGPRREIRIGYYVQL
jgi:hypothetical protein